jgi:exosome complex RNA-binding protein Rrp42 (RNase PH superfamily)
LRTLPPENDGLIVFVDVHASRYDSAFLTAAAMAKGASASAPSA